MGAILSPHGFYCYMTKKNKQSDGWNEWEKLVLSKLESHDNNISDILKQVQTANEHLFSFKLDVSKAIENHGATCKIAEEFPKISRDIEGIKASLNNIRKDEKVITENTKDIGTLRVDVAQLQVKSGLWGAVGGMISLVILLLTMTVKTGWTEILKTFVGK